MEAIPSIRFALGIYHRVNPNSAKKDIVPLLYLGVALSRSGEHEQEALDTLAEALDAADETPDMYLRNMLWARAEYSRILKRLGRMTEAEEQEGRIR